MILEQIEVTMMSVYCYVLGDEGTREGALIDPAGDLDEVFRGVEKHRLTVRYVINTHGHWDHTSGNDAVIKRTGAQLLIHEEDAEHLRSIPSRVLSRVLGGKGSPQPFRLLRDGDEIALGKLKLRVIHTPGHTPGGICLYIDGNVFTGDTLFTEGFGRTDFPGGSYEELMDSITARILTLPDDTKIWPGHNYGRFPVSTVREQKKYYR
jgi:glyoxylase-like metal-dependent hydrolase (beta-lactamase superfamily II)